MFRTVRVWTFLWMLIQISYMWARSSAKWCESASQALRVTSVSHYTYFHCNATQLPNTVRIRIWIRGTAGSSDKSVFNHGLVPYLQLEFFICGLNQFCRSGSTWMPMILGSRIPNCIKKVKSRLHSGGMETQNGAVERLYAMVADLHHFKCGAGSRSATTWKESLFWEV